MKKLGTKGTKVLKTLHLIFAMLWTSGGIAMILITFLSDAKSQDELLIKNGILLMIDNWLIIVSAIATFIIGIIYGVYTNWGFFKYKWITVKWIVTVIQMVYGTFVYHPSLTQNIEIINKLGAAATQDETFLSNLTLMQISGFFQSGLLLILIVISVFKPWKTKKAKAAIA